MPDVSTLLHPLVFIYLATVVGAQILLFWSRRRRRNALQAQRAAAGLSEEVLVDHAQNLETLRTEARTEAILLNATIFLTPVLFVLAQSLALMGKPATYTVRWLGVTWFGGDAGTGLALAFAAIIVWSLVSGTDVAKAFLGGIAFRAYAAFRHPFQVGDRVTIDGHTGKVREIGPIYVFLETPDDDLVTIPTASLWTQPLICANAGDRSSLCVMRFYLAPFASKSDRRQLEAAIWDAVQLSPYWDFAKPMQIFLEQTEDAIVFTAKGYVALTYNEQLFKTDVAHFVLDFASEHDIPLASRAWKHSVPSMADRPGIAP